jgi:hypothetical protein
MASSAHEHVPASSLTRADFLRLGAGAAALAVLPDRTYGATGAQPLFHSRPDLRPPRLRVAAASTASAVAPGYWFLGPSVTRGAQAGALIADASGQPVWFSPAPRGQLISNFRVQSYRGQPVLTWWQGKVVPPGFGRGEGVILDASYREIARVRAARGRRVDLHEFTLTPEGTALVICYPVAVPADLSHLGGPRQGHVLESVIQEIDIASGRLVMEWRSLGHVALSESYTSPWGGFDYMHANSVEVTPDGHLLVSARHTCALYKLHRRTGKVLWRLGGKRSSFALGAAARFAWQHDARHPSPSIITLFDDGEGPQRTEAQSRGLVLAVDARRRRVHLTRAYRHPRPLLASAMGSMQLLPDGEVAIGWGTVPSISEFTAAGALVSDVRLPPGCQSYRGMRFAWTGTPTDRPALAAVRDPSTGGTTLYASWNGATQAVGWQVAVGTSAGAGAGGSGPVVARSGFETAIPLGTTSGYATVTAVGAFGQPLATSVPVRLP